MHSFGEIFVLEARFWFRFTLVFGERDSNSTLKLGPGAGQSHALADGAVDVGGVGIGH